MIEVCETSAIGRALANFGLAGSEYSSSNEVVNAVAQQQPTNNNYQQRSYNQQKTTNNSYEELINLGLQVVSDNNGNQIITGDNIFANKDIIKNKFKFRWDNNNRIWFKPLVQQAA
jgi:hypothetical protein